jgi:hypothetical protein
MRKLFLSFLIIFTQSAYVLADEGMWILSLINKNMSTMQKMGLKLSADDIYNVNNSSLKDAIIQFGRGCTGEIISDQGLVLTNHHCGYGQIQAHSTVDHDYLTNGFWAANHSEELPNPGLTARFLVRMEEVTKDVLAKVSKDMDETKRTETIEEEIKKITKKVTEGNNYEAVVRPFFDGNSYYLFVYEVYRDVRLVGAPPSSIGKFGADTDNWMWPRHTADFALFRIYMSPDGKAADYSKDNVPFKPKHHLPVSIKGLQKDDFVMIMGYPGSTDRYLSSFGVENGINFKNPTIVNIRNRKLEIMREHMDMDPATRIKYASKYAQTANYWKYFIGQTAQLKNNNVTHNKTKIENDFLAWVNANPSRKEEYGKSLEMIKEAYTFMNQYEIARWYYLEAVVRGPEVILFAYRYTRLIDMMKDKTQDKDKLAQAIENYKKQIDSHFKDYSADVDKKMMAELLQMFNTNVSPAQVPNIVKQTVAKGKNNMQKYIDGLFAKSIFVEKSKLENALNKADVKAFENDPLYKLSKEMMDAYFAFNELYAQKDDLLKKGNRLFVKGLIEMHPDSNFYPNANSTMRLTYGKVIDYSPRDAVHYNYFTTYKGVLEKEDPKNWEFVVPEKHKEGLLKKDFGQYAPFGELRLNFISDNDITGGNSGSPVINGEGHLVGLAFDGNWEAMSGDISFEPKLQRTISVDILYVLYVIDKYAGAGHLIKEMTIVK